MANTNKKRQESVYIRSGRGLAMKVQSRFSDLNEAFASFDYNNASTENKQLIDGVIEKCMRAGLSNLLPLNDKAFKDYGYKNRITKKAQPSWRVGYATGKTAKKLSKLKYTVSASKGGNITINYVVPASIIMRLSPVSPAMYDSSKGYSNVAKAIAKWAKTKGIGVGTKKGAYVRFGYSVVSSWKYNIGENKKTPKEGKPDLMEERGLRITLNDGAKKAFLGELSNQMGTLGRDIPNNIIKETLKR